MTVNERLEQIFRMIFDEDIELSDDLTAADIDGWDSLQHVNLMFSIEQTFGVQFAGNELAEFADIGELRRFLEARSSA